jgi:hypothetical protein
MLRRHLTKEGVTSEVILFQGVLKKREEFKEG